MASVPARHNLNDNQREFVRSFLKCGDYTVAATAAGYSAESAGKIGWALLRTPPVAAAIQFEMRRDLVTDAPTSIRVLQHLRDKAESEKVRADCAKALLDRAGVIAPRAVADQKAHELSLNEMSLEDLRGLADKLESELATRAKPVSSANSAPVETQALDIA